MAAIAAEDGGGTRTEATIKFRLLLLLLPLPLASSVVLFLVRPAVFLSGAAPAPVPAVEGRGGEMTCFGATAPPLLYDKGVGEKAPFSPTAADLYLPEAAAVAVVAVVAVVAFFPPLTPPP